MEIPDIAETFCTDAIVAPLPPQAPPPEPRQNVRPNLAMIPHQVQPDDLVPNGPDRWQPWHEYDMLVRREIAWLRQQVADAAALRQRIEDQDRLIDDMRARLRGADASAEATADIMRGLTERLHDVLRHTHAITGT